jgi:hypothetical protein
MTNPFNVSPLVYRMTQTETTPLVCEAINDGIAPFPVPLIVPPGRYKAFGVTWDMTQPGLYRFCEPLNNTNTFQRIVNDGNLFNLVSGLQNIITQGYVDNALTVAQLTEKAKNKKISLSCSIGVIWVKSLLESLGYSARVVNGITAEAFNNYNDGHALIEVFYNGQWIVFDTSFNFYFTQSGVPLNNLQLCQAAQTGDFELVPMSKDLYYDLSGYIYQGYQNALYFEGMNDTQMAKYLYQRLMQIPCVQDGGYFYFCDTRKESQMIAWGYRKISEAEWMDRFYP